MEKFIPNLKPRVSPDLEHPNNQLHQLTVN